MLDSFAPISLTASVIPFTSSYRPFWLGLGAVSFDLLLAVIVTSLARRRIGYRGWRAVHWLSYAAWPVALLHGFGTGSDVRSGWLQLLSAVCVLLVLAAVLVRIGASRELSAARPRRGARGNRRLRAVPRDLASRRAARLRMGAALGHAQLAAAEGGARSTDERDRPEGDAAAPARGRARSWARSTSPRTWRCTAPRPTSRRRAAGRRAS